MLDIKKILSRSWHILWNYRVLWIFGFMLSLAMGGTNLGSNSSYRSGDGDSPSAPQAPGGWEGLQGDTPAEQLQDAFRLAGEGLRELQAQYPVELRMGIAAAITLFVIILLLSLFTAILRYVAETASIRMVDEYEQTGVKVGFRTGWKYGWSSTTWRLVLVNLIVHLPLLLLFVVLGLVTWWIIASALQGIESALVTSLIAGIGLAFFSIFITVVVMTVLYVLRDLAWRMLVIDNAGVLESLRMAAALVGRQWKNVGLVWLVMIGVKIAWAIAFFILVFPLLVVSILTALGGVLVAGLPALLTAALASLLAAPDYWPWVFAAIVALPLFFVIAFSPLILAGGWGLLYQSNVWTLTYRELKALEALAPPAVEAQ